MSNGKLYAIVVLMFVVAFVIIILRSSLQGLQWTPFLNNYLPKTRPALLYLPDIVQYVLMVVLIVAGIIALVVVQRRTSKRKQ